MYLNFHLRPQIKMAAPSAWPIKFTAVAKPGVKVKRSSEGANSEEKKKMRLIYMFKKEKHPTRAYNPKWKEGRYWLKYDTEKNLMTCSVCIEYVESGKQPH